MGYECNKKNWGALLVFALWTCSLVIPLAVPGVGKTDVPAATNNSASGALASTPSTLTSTGGEFTCDNPIGITVEDCCSYKYTGGNAWCDNARKGNVNCCSEDTYKCSEMYSETATMSLDPSLVHFAFTRPDKTYWDIKLPIAKKGPPSGTCKAFQGTATQWRDITCKNNEDQAVNIVQCIDLS